ncbi:hypothetical protein CV016_06465 [Yersinia kristensenii]|uniref:hypothetical protein n=1 Tax=Yersinia kristensenii TaxID=28152 RepID=UPI000C22CCBD|nr:hypothetical protein [Yersinia kristensenii]PJG63534.1 hypothetical protein CV016_06465 [Yersinia kristensenii]
MPVYLDAIPDVAPLIRRPDTRRWLYFLGGIMVAGNALTFWLWTGERTGLAFWFMASGLPFCLWGLMFSIRRFGYKCDQVWATSWDRERLQLLEQETARGQRAAWVLNSGIITQLGSGSEKLLKAIKSAESQLNVQIPRAGGMPVRHSRLPGFHDQQQPQDLDVAVKTIASQIKPVLANIPVNIPCLLMTDCDIAGVPDADEQILNILTLQTGRAFHLLDAKGLTALDLWLDEEWEQPAVLLAVSAMVRATPLADEGEAMTWILLLNRNHSDFSDAVRLHRPEKGSIGTLSKSLSRALLWGKIPAETVKGACTTGNTLAIGGEWSSACEGNRLIFSMTEDNRDVDQTTGYTGKAAPWLAVTLAATMAQQSGPQVAVAETNTGEIWVVGITPGDKTGINQDLS